jgi:hypothetical protein
MGCEWAVGATIAFNVRPRRATHLRSDDMARARAGPAEYGKPLGAGPWRARGEGEWGGINGATRIPGASSKLSFVESLPRSKPPPHHPPPHACIHIPSLDPFACAAYYRLARPGRMSEANNAAKPSEQEIVKVFSGMLDQRTNYIRKIGELEGEWSEHK